MDNKAIVMWTKNSPAIPSKVNDINDLVDYGLQLTTRDRNQIAKAFNEGSYEMVATFIWTKTINSLKNQLGKMGMAFISEMLDRPDIDETTNLQQAISEFDAIKLAEELGIINGTSAFRLRQAMETVAHFNSPDFDDQQDDSISEDETKTIVRACIQGILGYQKIDAAIDFKNFTSELQNLTLTDESPFVVRLIASPYFFHRTTIRILLSLTKSSTGAQLENALANANLIIPKLWNELKHPEKYQVGRSYSELFTDGKNKAASGLKQVLLKVKGFDFVPEDLRSTSFIHAANDVLAAHNSFNNFYNEPAPMNALYNMGSVIPIPAFPICMTAILSVRLGNRYGISNAAQDSVTAMLRKVTHDRWVYFFNECLDNNERLLYKLSLSAPADRWIELIPEKIVDSFMSEIKPKDVQNLLKFTKSKNRARIMSLASAMYEKLGYSGA